MKNLTLTLIAVALFNCLQAQAQDVPFSINTGEVKRDKITQRTYGIEPVGVDKDHVYYLYLPYLAVYGTVSHGSVENYFLAKFDKNSLKEVNKQELILKFENRKRQFHGIFHNRNKLYLFSAFQNEKQKKHYLFVQNVNKETLGLEDNMKMIGEIDYSGINKYNDAHFHYVFSPDSSKILVYYNVINNKNENLKYGMYVYSDQMELIWKQENVVPAISKGVFSYQKFMIDNAGIVYLKGINYTDLDNYYESANFKERGWFSKDLYYADVPNYTTQIYRFTEKGQDYAELSIPDKFIRSMTFVPEKNGKLLCAGIYSDQGKISARGSFIFNFDFNTKKIANLTTRDFGNELIELGFDEEQLKQFRRNIENKEEWDPFDYILSDIRTNKNGEKYFVAEQLLKGTKTERSGNMIIYKSIFYSNNLFVTKIGKDNKIARIDKINKTQYAVTTNQFNSYSLLENGSKLYFIFKEFLRQDNILKNVELGNGYIVELDGAGNQKKSITQPVEGDNELLLWPLTGIPASGNELIYSTVSLDYKDYVINKITVK